MKRQQNQKTIIFEIGGWIGVALVLASYCLLSLGIIDSNNPLYHLLILAGSILVGIISYVKHVFQPLVLNCVFIVLAIIALFRLFSA